MDELDSHLKQAVERALSDGALGQQVMETITGGLHAHDDKIRDLQSNVVSIGDQLL